MDVEKFNSAIDLRGKIDCLNNNLSDLKRGLWNEVKIELKTGYSDMGRDLTCKTTINGEIGWKIEAAIKKIITEQIDELEAQFNEL